MLATCLVLPYESFTEYILERLELCIYIYVLVLSQLSNKHYKHYRYIFFSRYCLERSCTYHVACIPGLVRYLPYDRKCQGYRIVGVGVFYQHEIPHTNSNPAQQTLPNIYKAGRVVDMYSKMILSSSLHNYSNLVGVSKLFTKNLQYAGA